MGAVADALAGLPEQLDKVLEEVKNANKLDADDLAMIDAVKAGVKKVDDENADAPVEPPV